MGSFPTSFCLSPHLKWPLCAAPNGKKKLFYLFKRKKVQYGWPPLKEKEICDGARD
jgi:hypothetical protein